MPFRPAVLALGLPVLLAVPLAAALPASAASLPSHTAHGRVGAAPSADAALLEGVLAATSSDQFVSSQKGIGWVANSFQGEDASFPAPGSTAPIRIGGTCVSVTSVADTAVELASDADLGSCTWFTATADDDALRFAVAPGFGSSDATVGLGLGTTARGEITLTADGSSFRQVTQGPFSEPALYSTTIVEGGALSGFASPAATVLVIDGDAKTPICEATADEHGDWSCTPSTALPVGEHPVELLAYNAAGQAAIVQDAGTVRVLADIPAPPLAPALTGETEFAAGTQHLAGTATGTAERVRVVLGGTTLCEAPVVDGAWSCDVELPAGTHTLTLFAIDGFGSASLPAHADVTVTPADAGDGNGDENGDGAGEVPGDGDDSGTEDPALVVTPVDGAGTGGDSAAKHDGALAYTGSEVAGAAGAAAALLALGTALTVAARRRRRA